MTKLIETQRAYSMALRVVTTTDEVESTINSISR
jgi:flagellar basal body rod protein FlgG